MNTNDDHLGLQPIALKDAPTLIEAVFEAQRECKVDGYAQSYEDDMSKLNVDQKTILDLFSDKKADFLIPDYQRAYAWDEEQCQTLWDDMFIFSFPNDNCDAFDENEEYFLGSIVAYKNENGKSEVIDGQQRLTTLMIILRAFYDRFSDMQDKNSKLTRELIEKCIWKTDAFGSPDIPS